MNFEMSNFFEILSQLTVAYFIASNLIFFALLTASYFAIRHMVRARPMIESIWKRAGDFGPAVSLIAPAFNEEKMILTSVRSFLNLDYPRLEVIIVNDGSTDRTLELLKTEFKLKEDRIFFDKRLSTTHVHQMYRSQIFSNLIVINKKNSGKADSINVGIGFSSFELFCAVDADCILDRDALLKVVFPFLDSPDATVAAGGTVRPLNGSALLKSHIVSPGLPTNPLVLFQVVEYLRAFLLGRVGWNVVNATMIISGAFGMFRRSKVIEAGAYRQDSVGEDMELVVRLRSQSGVRKEDCEISFIPDPICWTEVPSDMMSLGRQRERWQRGLAESLFYHRRLFLNPEYGTVGMVAYPIFFFFELLQPLIEFLSYLLIFLGWFGGRLSVDYLILFLVVNLLFGALMSFGAVLIEESAFHKYPKLSQVVVLIAAAIGEQIGFRQFIMGWRVVGLARFLLGRRDWGLHRRQGI